MNLKAYADAVSTGMNYLVASVKRHPDSCGNDGDAYFCEEDSCMYFKTGGHWIPFAANDAKIYCIFFWCPACGKKHVAVNELTQCDKCKSPVIQLDITMEIFDELPSICTKGDIVAASIGKNW